MNSPEFRSFQSGDRSRKGLGNGENTILKRIGRLAQIGVFCVLTSSTDTHNYPNFDYYVGLFNDYGYQVTDEDGFREFINFFGPVLAKLDSFALTGDDINNAMNLYSNWRQQNMNPEAFEMAYRYFLGTYSNPEIRLGELLSGIGITLPYYPPCDPGYCIEDNGVVSMDPNNPNRI